MEEEIDNLNFQEEEDEEEDNLYDPTLDPTAQPPLKKKKKKKIVLDENQKQKIKKTIEEMKVNQVQPQITCGREFIGPGFASNPPKIIYKDFEIGKKMTKTIDITNISYNFNTFHLQPLDDDIIDFFEIDYQRCGRIPAGISTKMTLHFTPLVNKDYKSNLKLLSETGMCYIPIECYCKKCIIEFEKNVIDYGEVILGQEINIPLIVSNNGALACKFTMCDKEHNLLCNPEEDEDDKENEFDLEPSYKDFTDRKIILNKYDLINDNKKNDQIILDLLKKEKVEKYKEDLINKEKENYENKKKEEEELLNQQQQNKDPKSKKDDSNKNKKKGKDNKTEPEVELINGLPVEIMNEIDKKVEEYSNNFKVETEEDKKFYENEDNKLKFKNMKYYMLKQLTYPLKGHFDSYSKKNVSIVLNAKYIGSYKLTVHMKIEYRNQVEYKDFDITFSVVDLPIYSEKKIYDLNYIIYDHIFREKIKLINDSNMPYKLQVFFHKDLKNYIELNPNLGYIQANSTFDVWLKIKIDKNINKLFSFFKAQNTEDNIEYNFPLKIVLNNIQIPLITVIHFWTTTDKILINNDKMLIDYGKRYIDESTKVKIPIENKSLLPMKYGFIMLPKEFTVRLNIDNLLAKEKTFVDIIYEPKDDFYGHREGDLFCRVVTDKLTCQNIKIKYHIELISPEIKIKPKFIRFEALAEGEYKELRIQINNNSNKKYDCEFLTPPYCISGLKIMPKVFTIEPEKYTTCVIRFDAEFREYGPFTYEEVESELGIKLSDGPGQMEKEKSIENNNNQLLEDKIKVELENAMNNALNEGGGDKKKKGQDKKPDAKKEAKKAEPKKDKKALEEEERKKKEEEERKLKEEEEKKEKRIKEFNKENELKYFGAETLYRENEDGFDRSAHWKFIIPLFFRLSGVPNNDPPNQNLKASFLEVHTTTVEKLLIFDKDIVDFGEVSVQTRKTINLILTNNSDKVAQLKMKPLILTNCFRIVNAIRDVNPHESFNYIIEFIPQKDLPYYDEFTVYTKEQTSTIKLKGIGVQPEVEISLKDGILFLGNTVKDNTLEKSFEIINKSNFKINFELKEIKNGKKNKSGIKSFCYVPYCGEIDAYGKVTVNVSFLGDHQDFENYFEFILVDVPNQKVENKILVMAYCWERQVYWKEFTQITFPDEQFINKTIEQDTFVDCLKIKSNSLSSNNDRIILVFTPDIDNNNNKKDNNNSKDNVEINNNNSTVSNKQKSSKDNSLAGTKYKDNKKDNNSSTELNDEKEKCYKRKIVIGNCKMNDPKNEKNGNYEIIMDKDDQYFSCDNVKGAINAGAENIITFSFKKPNPDPITKDVDCIKGVGMWITSKVELKISGGFIQNNAQDNVSAEILLKAYIEQL